MPDILHELTIAADTDAVYEAIVRPEGLVQWWTRDVQATPQTGGAVVLGFRRRSFTIEAEVECLEPGHMVSWICTGGHPEWIGTRITFMIGRTPDRTQLNLSHTGWAAADGILPRCSFDWARYLLSLKSYLETGEGRPHRG